MNVVEELVEAIEADPRDDGPQLVIADYLLSVEDPRGELIMLDRQERAGELTDPAALERLLLLAAQYSFPRAEPDDPLLPFEYFQYGDRSYYAVTHADRVFELYTGAEYPERVYIRVRFVEEDPDGDDDDDDDGVWTYSYLNVGLTEQATIFRVVSDAIHANTSFEDLKFPSGPLAFPQYEGSPLRCYMLPVEFLRRHDLIRTDHGLAARDYYRWHKIWERVRGMTPR